MILESLSSPEMVDLPEYETAMTRHGGCREVQNVSKSASNSTPDQYMVIRLSAVVMDPGLGLDEAGRFSFRTVDVDSEVDWKM